MSSKAPTQETEVRTSVELDNVRAVVEGRHETPFEILGPHEIEDAGRRALAVRAYLPHTEQVWLVHPPHNGGRQQGSQPMRRIHAAGLYEAICPVSDPALTTSYQLRVVDQGGRQSTMHDPYAFPPLLTDYDLHLLGEGTHWQSYTKLGAHLRTVGGIEGVNFAVWAPNAQGVSVVGDFNGWDGRRHPMRKHIPGGIWELFVPGLGESAFYKFRVKQAGGEEIDKADPYGF